MSGSDQLWAFFNVTFFTNVAWMIAMIVVVVRLTGNDVPVEAGP